MATEFDARIKFKRDTDSNWTSNDPVLLNGEIILVDMDNGEIKIKIGDGSKTYTQLPFIIDLSGYQTRQLSEVPAVNEFNSETVEGALSELYNKRYPLPSVQSWLDLKNLLGNYSSGIVDHGYTAIGMDGPVLVICSGISHGSTEYVAHDGSGKIWRGRVKLDSELSTEPYLVNPDPITAVHLTKNENGEFVLDKTYAEILEIIQSKRSVIVYADRAPDDIEADGNLYPLHFVWYNSHQTTIYFNCRVSRRDASTGLISSYLLSLLVTENNIIYEEGNDILPYVLELEDTINENLRTAMMFNNPILMPDITVNEEIASISIPYLSEVPLRKIIFSISLSKVDGMEAKSGDMFIYAGAKTDNRKITVHIDNVYGGACIIGEVCGFNGFATGIVSNQVWSTKEIDSTDLMIYFEFETDGSFKFQPGTIVRAYAADLYVQ